MRSATLTRPLPWRRLGWAGAGALALALAAALLPRTLAPQAPQTAQATPRAAEPAAPVALQRALRFRDRTDGGIDIVDAASGRPIDQAHGEQGFLRGTLRAMARERRLRGVGADAALMLTLDREGRLALVDPPTGTRIELDAFGPTNAAVFARWLVPQGDRP